MMSTFSQICVFVVYMEMIMALLSPKTLLS